MLVIASPRGHIWTIASSIQDCEEGNCEPSLFHQLLWVGEPLKNVGATECSWPRLCFSRRCIVHSCMISRVKSGCPFPIGNIRPADQEGFATLKRSLCSALQCQVRAAHQFLFASR